MKRLITLCLAMGLLLTGCSSTPQESVSATVFSMDTVMTVTAYGDGADEAVSQATEDIYRIERLFSVTREDSEIAVANAAAGGETELSAETAALLSMALQLWEETDGAYNPALYPVLRAWGFTGQDYRVPEAEELAALLADTDPGQIALESDRVVLPPGMELDLGGIVKGYTGDYLAALMAEMGVESAIFDLGGDVRTVGRDGEGKPWRVALADPDGGGYIGILEVEDAAVITSGSYERNFTGEDGRRYHHILDPSTGMPADNGLVSVTVVTSNGTRGDALATALFVMGLEDGAAFAEGTEDLEVIFLTEDGQLWLTEGLKGQFTAESGYTANWL